MRSQFQEHPVVHDRIVLDISLSGWRRHLLRPTSEFPQRTSGRARLPPSRCKVGHPDVVRRGRRPPPLTSIFLRIPAIKRKKGASAVRPGPPRTRIRLEPAAAATAAAVIGSRLLRPVRGPEGFEFADSLLRARDGRGSHGRDSFDGWGDQASRCIPFRLDRVGVDSLLSGGHLRLLPGNIGICVTLREGDAPAEPLQ